MVKKLAVFAPDNFPLIEPGDNLAERITACLVENQLSLEAGDCLVVAQKIISKAENRYAYLNDVTPSAEAASLAVEIDKDPRLVELILQESTEVIRHRPGAVIVEHRQGYVHANAGIDQSNIHSDPDNPRVLLLPVDADQSAAVLLTTLEQLWAVKPLNIIISDSAGRAWRNGIIGFALGTAGFEPVMDEIGKPDLFGRELTVTQIAIADELAAAASILMGQAANGLPVVLIKGAPLRTANSGSKSLIRAKEKDLFR